LELKEFQRIFTDVDLCDPGFFKRIARNIEIIEAFIDRNHIQKASTFSLCHLTLVSGQLELFLMAATQRVGELRAGRSINLDQIFGINFLFKLTSTLEILKKKIGRMRHASLF
jgi:hypothetical protein